MRATHILVVEDDASMRATCIRLFGRAGYEAMGAATANGALEWLQEHGGDCIVLTDVRMPGMDGLELLDEINNRWPAVDVVVMTVYGSIDNAVDAMKRGAVDYVTKPFNKDELVLTIDRVARLRGLQSRVDELESSLETRYRFADFVATSPSMRDVLQRMRAAADSMANVLLTGESGTGKDLVARLIHFGGPRSSAPFVPVNCAGLPAELIESELFGHVRGAYTGAVASHEGLVRRARHGTIFLDEVTEMPTGTQAKLLRVLQDKKVRPVGGTEEVEVDVRIIASTNQDIQQALAAGTLREDLYYRLSVLNIHLPPLRERLEDVVPLLRYFLDRLNHERPAGEQIDGIDQDAVGLLLAHTWPGNVRELSNLLERCYALGLRGTLKASDIQRELGAYPSHGPAPARTAAASGDNPMMAGRGGAPGQDASSAAVGVDNVPSLEEMERQAIIQALERTGNNKAAAARLLGIARKTLYDKIRRYRIDS